MAGWVNERDAQQQQLQVQAEMAKRCMLGHWAVQWLHRPLCPQSAPPIADQVESRTDGSEQ